jgi:hypothetical protein
MAPLARARTPGQQSLSRTDAAAGTSACTVGAARTRDSHMDARFGVWRTITRARARPWPIAGRSASLPTSLPSLGASPVGGRGAQVLACAADDGGHGALQDVCLRSCRPPVVGEGDLIAAQVADYVLFTNRADDLDSLPARGLRRSAAGLAPVRRGVQGRQVRQDAVLADTGVWLRQPNWPHRDGGSSPHLGGCGESPTDALGYPQNMQVGSRSISVRRSSTRFDGASRS